MTILARTRLIIQQLYRNSRYVSVSEIATQLNQTERTVYREIREVIEVLNSCGVKLESAAGKGLKLSGDPEDFDRLEELIGNATDKDISSADRGAVLEFELLEGRGFIKTLALSMDSKTSVQTARGELKVLERRLVANNLELEVKKGQGVRVNGPEIIKRHYLANMLAMAVDVDVFINWVVDGKLRGNPVLKLLRDHGYHDVATKIFTVLIRVTKEHRIAFSDRSLRDIIFLVSMLVVRRDREVDYAGRVMHPDTSKRERTFITDMVLACEAAFSLNLLPAEREYLGWLGTVILAQPEHHAIGSNQAETVRRTAHLISKIEAGLNVRLSYDHQLLKALGDHLHRAVTRIQNGIIITNPINRNVQQSYPALFGIVKKSAETVFKDIVLPDEEVGYLVLYVVIALDQLAAESFRVLVICSSGMGSSKLLTARLEREIAEVKVVKQIALVDLPSESLEDYDLVISTVPIYQAGTNIIMVSPLLTDEESTMVRQMAKRHRDDNLSRMSAARSQTSQQPRSTATDLLAEAEAISRSGLRILKGLRVSSNIGSQTDLIKALGSMMFRLELINDPDLMRRYENGEDVYFKIPGSRLAYAAYRVPELATSSLLILRIDPSKAYHLGETQISAIAAIAVLLYPERDESYPIDYVQTLVLMLVGSVECIEALESGEERAIRTVMGEYISDYLAKKLKLELHDGSL